MKQRIRSLSAVFGIGASAAMLLASTAHAGCLSVGGEPAAPGAAPEFRQAPSSNEARMMPAGFMRVADTPQAFRPSIVGLWKFSLTASGNPAGGPPDGTVIDSGYTTWHADRTELMNSGKSPASSSFCMGVWKPTGPSTYRLNHFALSWTNDGATFIGPASIHEEVTLASSGNAFDGSFAIDQYDVAGTTLIGHVTGTVSATRLTAD